MVEDTVSYNNEYKIYSFIIDEFFINASERLYSVKLKLEYKYSLMDYIYGFDDYLSNSGYRCNYEARYKTKDILDIIPFIEFVAKKHNIKNYLIENYDRD